MVLSFCGIQHHYYHYSNIVVLKKFVPPQNTKEVPDVKM
jgi:hypothetical protein